VKLKQRSQCKNIFLFGCRTQVNLFHTLGRFRLSRRIATGKFGPENRSSCHSFKQHSLIPPQTIV